MIESESLSQLGILYDFNGVGQLGLAASMGSVHLDIDLLRPRSIELDRRNRFAHVLMVHFKLLSVFCM